MPQPKQLSLDTLIAKRKALPDGWKGNAYQHYGDLYGIRIIGYEKGSHTPGKDYSVAHGRIENSEVQEEEEE
jgi:hypothetical protein